MSNQQPQPLSMNDFAEIFSPRDPSGHKGTFGSAAIFGGGPGMTGAAILAARAALKAGTGRVYIGFAQAQPELTLDVMQPEVMCRPIESLLTLSGQITAWGVGCGMGDSSFSLRYLKDVFMLRDQTPMVVDADALNALARGDIRPTWGLGPVVMTPHPTEAARLLDSDASTVNQDRASAAQTLAKQYGAWVVLKGQGTIVCNPDGHCQINTTGTVGLASAGTGDVLTGLLTGLLAQGVAAEIAVPAAVWLHGRAAEVLGNRIGGHVGLTASELTDAIRQVRNQPGLQ